MASEIEAAAERVMRIAQHEGKRDVYGSNRTYQRNKYSLDLLTVASDLTRRLAADRAERDERALPIDAEWLSSIFDEEFDEAFSSRSIMLGVLVPACGRCGWTWVVGDVHVATVTTRGQLLDLLRVLKGGAE